MDAYRLRIYPISSDLPELAVCAHQLACVLIKSFWRCTFSLRCTPYLFFFISKFGVRTGQEFQFSFFTHPFKQWKEIKWHHYTGKTPANSAMKWNARGTCQHCKDDSSFYPRDAMLSRSLRQRRAVRPSDRLSHAGTVPSRAKAGSWNVHHLIAPWF